VQRTETLPDEKALRLGRRERAFAEMEAHDLDVLVLGRVANMRYLSGVPMLWNAGTRPFGPGCVAVRRTNDIYLLSTWDEGVPEEIPHDHLFGITWNPMNYVKVLKQIAADAAPRRVGTDGMSPLFAQLLPMAFPDAEIVDASPALRAARRIKTAEEVDAIRNAVAVADACLDAAEVAVRPGVSERDVTAAFMDAMASRGVTTPSRQDVARIDGDVVMLRGGVVADGYAGEAARTVPSDPACDALLERLIDACQPGASGTALFDAYEAAGVELPAEPVARGLGLGFDDPVIVRDLPETAAQERLDPGVVIAVTARVGAAVATAPVHVTPDGPEVLR
jgi:Xaa-Pro aminopeptidase